MYFQGDRAWVPESIRRAGKPTILIATDDPYDPISRADVLYTFRFTNEIHAATHGASYLPTATELPPPTEPSAGPEYDLAFIGTLFEDRWPWIAPLARHCQERQLRMFIAGNMRVNVEELEQLPFVTVRRETIRPAEKWSVYARSRVVLNLFRRPVASRPDAEPEPADGPTATELCVASPNPRVFEVTAAGGPALLSGPRRSEVTRIFGQSVYQFDDLPELFQQLDRALTDEAQRAVCVEQARRITVSAHLYEHRARDLMDRLQDRLLAIHRLPSLGPLADSAAPADADCAARSVSIAAPSPEPASVGIDAWVAGFPEERLGWIFGCGRTGSTWLAEMLDDVDGLRSWNEPYFGRVVRQLEDRPDDRRRPSAFFYDGYYSTWRAGLRRLFFEMLLQRYPEYGHDAVIVKEINAPEICPLLRLLFPGSRYILLLRDPWDVLDSYIDMHKPGSWSRLQWESPPDELSVRRVAEHIRSSFTAAQEGFERFPASQRLQLRYEELLRDPAAGLAACAALVGVEASPSRLGRIVDKHRFERHQETGELAFRRYGRAGVWQTSANFAEDHVTRVAHEILGPVRVRLGYGKGE
jgi:hypothetical protein